MVIFTIALSIALTAALASTIYLLHKSKQDIRDLEELHRQELSKVAREAKQRSGAVQWGLAIENFVPFMDKFPIPAEDCHFFGKPIDFIGFTDMEDKDKCEIHIIEVKSGRAQLNKHQRSVKEAVANNRVNWHEVRVKANTVK